MEEKMQHLKEYLSGLGSVAVAFSGGVDSTFLLKTAHMVLGENAIAVTARSVLFPQGEFGEAAQFCRAQHIRQLVVEHDAMGVAGFAGNPPDRCYLCKRALFGRMRSVAEENGVAAIVEGTNKDDEGDYRPGMRAIEELGVRSPLREAGLTKAEIRELSGRMSLPTADKPSLACLASRFVYGEALTEQGLKMVGQAEHLLRESGFRQVRVRVHGTLARIEVMPEEFFRLMEPSVRERVVAQLRDFGFSYVAMDLQGYRTGSMNRTIKIKDMEG